MNESSSITNATGLVVEGLVTTLGPDDQMNLAPMGPLVVEPFTRFILRPFRTSATYANLRERPEGVFHVTDDVELLARAAVDRLEHSPATRPATRIHGHVLQDNCHAYEFQVTHLDDSDPRARIECLVVASQRGRDFLGFNRASHAVLEGAILATRLHLLTPEHIQAELRRLSVIVEKTAGPAQRRAFDFLEAYIEEQTR